jgi:hypothetical protein
MTILSYFTLHYLQWLFFSKLAIFSYFILGYFRLFKIIFGYFWLFLAILSYFTLSYFFIIVNCFWLL